MKIWPLILFSFSYVTSPAQEAKIFSGDFYNKSNDIALHLNLLEETINIPGFSMLGPTNGYMNGNVYGTWIVTSFKIKDKTFKHVSADTFSLEMKSPQVMRKVVKRKLVKIPSKYLFIKK